MRATRRRGRTARSELGSASVELVLVAPVLAAVVLVLVAGGRLAIAEQTIASAASAAARDASLGRSPGDAEQRATDAAAAYLDNAGLDCARLEIDVDASALGTVLGESGAVTARIDCVVALGDITLPGLGGSRTLTATATSPIDPFKERR